MSFFCFSLLCDDGFCPHFRLWRNRNNDGYTIPKNDPNCDIFGERFGDFEGDTVLLNGLERLYTFVDRKSGFLFVRHIPNGHAETIYQETLKIQRKYQGLIESITYDNGVEFSYHDLITTDTKIPIYFCYPYHSWERGTNENTNGLLRQYFPKKELHGKITQSDIKEIEEKLNNRPRKRLNYLTPYEVFVKKKWI